MQLDKLNQWLTLAAHLGVIAGIVILVLEISQNTEALQLMDNVPLLLQQYQNNKQFLEPDFVTYLEAEVIPLLQPASPPNGQGQQQQ